MHEAEPFVIPNPWDAGSAKVLASLGYKALATTSGGMAFTLGRLDGDVTLDEVVEHTRAIAAATDLPYPSISRMATAQRPRTPPAQSPVRPKRAPSVDRSRI